MFGLLLGLSSFVLAQDQPVDAKPPKPTHRRIYIPTDELDLLIQRDGKGVLLPNGEFEELYNLAKANGASAGPNAADIVLSSANYDARLDGSLLRITVEIQFTQFVDDWRGLPLPFGSLAVEKATLNGEPARIGRATEQKVLYVVNGDKGKQTLTLELSTETASTGVEKLATLTLLPAPVGNLTLHLDAGQHLLIDGLSLTRPAEAEQPADYQIPVGGRSELSLHITDRPSEQTTDALVFATTAYGVYVSPGEVTWNTRTSLQVFGQPINRLTFTIPKPLEIADVVSPGLEGWELADSDDGDATVLTLSYRQPIRGERTVQVRGVMTIPAEEAWPVPTLTIENITSHIGRLIVRYPAGVRLQMAETEGARPAALDSSIPPGEVQFSQVMLFDVWRQDFNLQFLTQQKKREVQAALSTMININNTGADLQLAATIESRFAPLFELEMTLPSEFVIREVTMNGSAVKWHIVSNEAGINELRIPLEPSLAPGVEANFMLKAHRDLENWPVEIEPVSFAIPEVTLPQAGVVEGTYVVMADGDLDVAPAEVAGLDPVFLGLDGERLGYRYQDTHFSGQLTVSRKPTRLSAQSLIFARLDRETWHALYQMTVTTQGGGTKSLELTLAENAGTDLRFDIVNHAARIIEQIPSAPKEGVITWTLRFDQRLQGTFMLGVEVDRPRGKEDELKLSPLKVIGADRQNGYVAWEASEEQQLNITAVDDAGDALAEVDPLDLPPTNYTPKERIVSVYRFTTPDYTMIAKEQRYDRHPVPTAVCYNANVDSILGETGEWQHRAVYHLSATSVQSLEVRFPNASDEAATELWAAIIDKQPIEVRHVGEAYSISLPAIAEATAVRVVELYYRNHTSELKTFGKLQQQLPLLAIVGGTGAAQPLTVLDQTWSVHYPEHVVVIESDGRFEPIDPLERPSLLGQLQRGLTQLSVRDVGQKMAVFGVVAFIAIMLASLGARKKTKFGWLGILVVILIIGVMIALLLPATQQAREAARRTSVAFTGGTSEQMGVAVHNYHDVSVDFDFNGQDQPAAGAAAAPGSDDPSDFTMPMPAKQPGMTITNGSIDVSGAGVAGQPLPPQAAEQPMDDAAGDEGGLDDLLAGVAAEKKSKDRDPLSGKKQDAGSDGFASLGITAQAGSALDITNGDFSKPYASINLGQLPGMELYSQVPQRGVMPMVDGPGPGRIALGGLLSLTIPFHAPEGSLQKTFRYLGDGLNGESPDLDVSYEDRETRGVLRTFLILLVLLPVWLLRERSLALRLAYLILGIALPLALVPLVPVRWQIFLDGIFVGALCGVVFMLVLGCLRCCRTEVCSLSSMKRFAKLRLWSLVLPFALLAGLMNTVTAQDQAQQNPPATEQQKIVAPPDDSLPSDPNALQIYIPYEPGSDPLAAERVFLPYETFVKLWNQAHPDKKILREAPLKALVTEAIYSAKLAGTDAATTSVVAVTGRIAIYNLEERQHVVALPFHGVALRSAKLNGESAAVLAPTPDHPQPRLALSTKGLNVLDVEFDVPVKLAGAAGQFLLPLDPVASGRLTFALPAADLNVRINGSKSAYRLRKEGEASFVDVPIDRGGDLSVSWQPEEERGAVDSTVLAETSTAVSLDDAGLSVSQGFSFAVKQGSLSELTFDMPEPLRLRRIDGVDVGGWEIQGLGDERTLRIFLRRKVTDTTALAIELFHEAYVTAEAATVDLPLCVPTEVTRETGTIALFAGDQLTLRLGPVDGLQQSEISAFHEVVPLKHLSTPPLAVYRYRLPIASLPLSLSRRQPESRVQGEHGLFLSRRKQHLTSRLLYNLTGAPRSVLPIRMPEGYLVLEVFATGLTDWSQTPNSDGTGQILLLELDSPRTGAVEVVLSGTIPRDAENNSPALDFPYPLEVNRYQAVVALWIDNVYITQLKEFFGWKSIGPDQLPAELRNRNTQPVQLAFTSVEQDPDLILLELTRAQPAMTADSLTVVTVSETAITYALAMQWKITKAAAETFQFTTPDWLKGKLDFQVGGLRQVTQTDLPDGRVLWTVTLQDAVHQNLFLTAIATLPPSAEDEVLLPALEFEQASGDDGDVRPLETQRHYILTVNQSRSQLAPLDEELVELIPREEVPIVIPDEIAQQATQIVRLLKPRTAPVVELQRFELQQGIPASVNLSELTTVIERDGSWRTAAVYRIKNRSRQFLALWIPEEARILSVFVQGQAARPVEAEREGKTMHLVALPKVSAADLSATVKIVLAGRMINAPLPKGFRLTAKEIDLPAPQVVSTQEDAAYGLPVAKTQWTIYLPDDLNVEPIDDRDRNNLEPVLEEEVILAKEEFLYSEAKELSSLLAGENGVSMRSKQQAFENLKQIQRHLDEFESVRGEAKGRAVDAKKAEKLEEQRKVLDDVIMSNSGIASQSESSEVNPDAFQYRQLQEQSESLLSSNGIALGIDVGTAETPISNFSGESLRNLSQPMHMLNGPAKKDAKQQAEPQSRSRRMAQSKENLDVLQEQLQLEIRQSQTVSENGPRAGGMMGGMGGGMGGMGGMTGKRSRTPAQFGGVPARSGPFEDDYVADGYSNIAIFTPFDADEADLGNKGITTWTQQGGLSLPIDLPTSGQKLVFSKVTGSPKLALSLRTRETVATGVGFVWTLVWFAAAIVLVVSVLRFGLMSQIFYRLPEFLLAIGVVGYFLMPRGFGGFAVLFLVMFVAGVIALAVRRRRAVAAA
ncbi:MAG: hypothetical protein WEB58_01940 [Planctomycetaceae bacterium]